jgi:hypothetical protein
MSIVEISITKPMKAMRQKKIIVGPCFFSLSATYPPVMVAKRPTT